MMPMDGAEESDEDGDIPDGGEPGHATLHCGQGFARCGLGGAFERYRVTWKAASAVLPWYSSWISLKTATRGLGV